ncbi:hypothetical protein [Chryseobacterium arthrosphaerae]|uniref:Outer membrane protein beta-barrel domain-containing protein n=1 Tax=Chryseobacterium arthrosphaerae TaxID=651561 RepID=A0A1B8ZUJ7_9FLAO|nr:hypothetical protein [Chryseobacterium arthrosphaerae]OCA75266.1 hypothetical protein BBI00_13400 [Chryseobacterium arthrosphaerae]
MIKKLILLGFISSSLFSFAQKVTISPAVGYAWRVAETASGLSMEERNYVKGLKSGVHFEIAAYYNLKNIGIGAKFSNYNASSSGTLRGYANGQTVSVPVSIKDNITFFGPSVMFSNYTKPTKHKFAADVSIGVISYTTKTGYIKGTGSNLGLEAGIGYQYEVSKNFLIGPKFGFTAGTLNKMEVNGRTMDLANDQKEGLTRVSLSAAAAFRF